MEGRAKPGWCPDLRHRWLLLLNHQPGQGTSKHYSPTSLETPIWWQASDKHLRIPGEKGRLAFEKMDKLHSEQEAYCQEADVEITIF